MWPFNEEIVARAIYDSEIPIISAVGHETDFTIADFVADLRAPTPSAGAELAQIDVAEVKAKIESYKERCKTALKQKVQFMKLRYEKVLASKVFKEPTQKINEYYLNIDMKLKNMEMIMQNKIKESKLKAMNYTAKLDALSPLKTLTRGYSIVESNGKVLKSIKEVKDKETIDIRLTDGKITATVEKTTTS